MDTNQVLAKVGFESAFDKMLEAEIDKAENKKGPETVRPKKVILINKKDKFSELVEKIAALRKDGEQGVEIESDNAVEVLNSLISQAREITGVADPFPSFGYFVNLNERGFFEADVRNSQGISVFQIKSGLSLPRGESDLIEDGFMKHGHDIKGLEKHLKEINVMPQAARLLSAEAFDSL